MSVLQSFYADAGVRIPVVQLNTWLQWQKRGTKMQSEMKQTTLIVFIDLSWREFKGHLYLSSGKIKITKVKSNLLNRNAIYCGIHVKMMRRGCFDIYTKARISHAAQ